MKKLFILTLFVTLGTFSSFGQSLDISGNVGWFWSSRYNYGSSYLRIDDATNYNISIGLPRVIEGRVGLEFSYSSVETMISYHGYYDTPGDFSDDEVKMDYYLLSGVLPFEDNESIEPYGIFGLGAANGRTYGEYGKDVWNFAIGGGVGANIFITPSLGIKVQGRLLAPLDFGSVGMYCGTGSGCGLGAGAVFTVIQGDFSGGIVIRI